MGGIEGIDGMDGIGGIAGTGGTGGITSVPLLLYLSLRVSCALAKASEKHITTAKNNLNKLCFDLIIALSF